MKLFQHINVNVNVNSVIREGNKPGNYGDKIKSQSLTTQQAFPRSAILTRIDSALRGSSGLMRRSAALALTEGGRAEQTQA